MVKERMDSWSRCARLPVNTQFRCPGVLEQEQEHDVAS